MENSSEARFLGFSENLHPVFRPAISPLLSKGARLGLDVIKPSKSLSSALWKLRAYYQGIMELEGEVQFRDGQHYVLNFDGFIDTVDERRVLSHHVQIPRARPLKDKYRSFGGCAQPRMMSW